MSHKRVNKTKKPYKKKTFGGQSIKTQPSTNARIRTYNQLVTTGLAQIRLNSDEAESLLKKNPPIKFKTPNELEAFIRKIFSFFDKNKKILIKMNSYDRDIHKLGGMSDTQLEEDLKYNRERAHNEMVIAYEVTKGHRARLQYLGRKHDQPDEYKRWQEYKQSNIKKRRSSEF